MTRRPLSAAEREELKYAHLARARTDAVRRNRKQFEAYVESIQPDPPIKPNGPCLELALRYREIGRGLVRNGEAR